MKPIKTIKKNKFVELSVTHNDKGEALLKVVSYYRLTQEQYDKLKEWIK